ncbi:AAA family ATPase [Treponema sp. OMZ 788]|uniref:UvrD-helicase domain-containing protein n=1 Tax=Treponema sp. OMZ 788 TaxID=2563664 RepID=UPI0020A530EE|nr:UvrD-helicase domain-containing protein [Treponema sp. OMZ 788]UTC64537.1 AAA family ATPase [Treponema sp. OMZ 788]
MARKPKSEIFHMNKNPFDEKDEYLDFDIINNAKRLTKQQDGDNAFYYLALYSFIEGYIRHKLPKIYSFDSRDQRCLYEMLQDLIDIFSSTTDDNEKVIKKQSYDYSLKSISQKEYYVKMTDLFCSSTELTPELIKSIKENLSILQDFGCISFLPDYFKKKKELYISTDRVRHNFSNQAIENLQVSILEFYKFAENFGFMNEDIKSLRDNTEIFKNHINRVIPDKDSDSYILLDKNKTLTEELNKIKQKYSASEQSLKDFKEKITDLTAQLEKNENIFEDSNINDDYKKYLDKQEQLRLNQNLLTHYAESWRNYQLYMSTLTEDQINIYSEISNSIKNNTNKNYLIQGGPGTGKTIILIHLLQNFINKDILLLTYTSSLNKYNNHLSKTLIFNGKSLSEHEKELASGKIKTFDEFIKKKAEKILKKEVFIPNRQFDYADQYSKKIKEVIMTIDKTNQAGHIFHQALAEVWGLIPSEADYVDHSYSLGKENTITDNKILADREVVWRAIKKLEEKLDAPENKVIPLEYACYKLSKMDINNEDKIDYLLIDEIQDLTVAKIKAISKLTRKNYIMTGDLAQSVFIRKGLTWHEIDALINKKKATLIKPLTKNFRSTIAIQNLANLFLLKENFLIKDEDVVSEGFMPGPTPDYSIFKNETDTLNKIKDRIKILKEELFFENKDFCIVASSKKELEAIKNTLGSELPSKEMEDKTYDFAKDDVIKLSTVKYVKGIDCPVVILFLSQSFINRRQNGNLDSNSQMNGIYACITRAMNILSVFISNNDDFLSNKPDCSINRFLQVLEQDGINYAL